MFSLNALSRIRLRCRLRAEGQPVAGGREGLPRGTRYVSLGGVSSASRGAGARDATIRLRRVPRSRLSRLASASLRVTMLVSGPGSPGPRVLAAARIPSLNPRPSGQASDSAISSSIARR